MHKEFKEVLFALIASHNVLFQAEYNRNDSVNDHHPGYIAEMGITTHLEKHDPSVYTELLNYLTNSVNLDCGNNEEESAKKREELCQ